MIVPMKKIHIIVQNKEAVKALEILQDLDAIHVEHQESLGGYQLEERRGEVDMLTKAIAVLKERKDDSTKEQKEFSDWTELVNQILSDEAQIVHRKESIAKRQILINQWEPWGDFDPEDFESFRKKGIFITLCQKLSSKNLELPKDVIFKKIFTAGGMDRCIMISSKEVECPYDVVQPPKVSLRKMKIRQEEHATRILELEKKIDSDTCYLESLEKHLKEREDVLAFEEVEQGMREEGQISVLKGFCPQEACKKIEEEARKNKWAVLIEEPTQEDNVPTLLENPKWVQLSNPALNMIEILPGYGEVDVSKVFIIFFTLFFGMLIGDAAYGVIFAGLTFFAQRKLGKKLKDHTAFYLMYLLTGFTIIWGVLTGTYFGQEWLPVGVKPLVPWLNDPENLQWLCFSVALAHLSIARLWAFKKKLPSITAVAEIGWLFIVWGMYFLANMFVLSKPFPEFAKAFFIVGIALSFIFMVPFRDFAKKVPQEVVPYVLGVIGAGTDIVSYVRLFAVGLATIAVADAANSMPGADLPAGLNYFLFIFLHLLNMVLAAMAILVHAIRLNVLEFSGHLGLEWAGFKYNPFSKKLKQA